MGPVRVSDASATKIHSGYRTDVVDISDIALGSGVV